jgi:predicted amidohydrolase YtcJ
VKLFADGTLGSRTAALLEPFEAEPDRPRPPGGERGVFTTEPAELARLALEAGDAGIATMIHAIGDHAVRVALRALEPVAGRTALMPRVEHVQLCAAADARRFAPAGIAASVQPIHLRTDADQARRLWGDRAERRAYAWAALAATGAVVAFGTDAPVEPIDPWPGIALAVTRRSPDWGPGAGAFGPDQAMTLARALRSACVDAAVSAGESDRGRLVAGRRADVVVIPAAALVEPVEAGGALENGMPIAIRDLVEEVPVLK